MLADLVVKLLGLEECVADKALKYAQQAACVLAEHRECHFAAGAEDAVVASEAHSVYKVAS